jgi:plastocyanin
VLRRLSLAALLPLMVPPGAIARLPAAAARSHTVTIENVQYNPAHLTVRRGERIVWVNKDLFPHTVTATDKAFDSGSIDVSKSWTFLAKKPGTFSYSCTFHPTMKGTIEVK